MSEWQAQERELVRRLRCPLCGGGLAYPPADAGTAQAVCSGCEAHWPQHEGVWQMLTPTQQNRYAPFLDGYHTLRRHEGWERPAAYYLGLPQVVPTDPASATWRIRRRSFYHLQRLVAPRTGGWALDLGAGNGWLARWLVRWGYQTVAADLNACGIEGLAGGQLYLDADGAWFGRVQATMDALPFKDAGFALCTISGALYYADLCSTLHEVARVLQPGGLLVITDSPVYTQAAAGAQMAAEQRARTQALLGRALALPGGPGYLVAAPLLAELQAAGFSARLVSTERVWSGGKRLLRRLQPGRREEARFPVIVARK